MGRQNETMMAKTRRGNDAGDAADIPLEILRYIQLQQLKGTHFTILNRLQSWGNGSSSHYSSRTQVDKSEFLHKCVDSEWVID